MGEITSILDKAGEALSSARELIQSVVTGDSPSQSTINHTELGIDPDHPWDGGDGLLEFDAQGAGTSQLSDSMSGLSNLLNENPALLDPPYEITPEVRSYVEGIAEARGISVEQAEKDYLRFADLVNAGEIDISGGIFIDQHGYGNESQLRFGYVVGDALGIDPAFASLMNPSGGLTGPGGVSLNIDGDGLLEELASAGTGVGNEALSYHGPTHDALGFLRNEFDTGPGYCYVEGGGDCTFDTDSPYSGQISGIGYWEDKLDLGPVDAVSDAGQEIGREGSEAFREIGREGSELVTELGDERAEAGQEISGEFHEAGREISEADGASGVTAEVIEGGAEIIFETGEGGLELVGETAEGIMETGLEIGEGSTEILREGLEGSVELIDELKDEMKGDGIPYVPGF